MDDLQPHGPARLRPRRRSSRTGQRRPACWRRLSYELLEFRRLLAVVWSDSHDLLHGGPSWARPAAEGEALATDTNPSVPADVNADGYLSALDPLLVANHLDWNGGGAYEPGTGAPPFLDFNADGLVDEADREGVAGELEQAGPVRLPEPRLELPSPVVELPVGPLVSVRLQLTDEEGNPLERVESGQPFQLEAWVADRRGGGYPQGVFASYLDVSYDSTRVALDGGFTHGPSFGSYAVEDISQPGWINDTGSGRREALHDDAEHLLWRIPLRARGVGTAEFSVDARDVDVALPTLVSGLDRPVPAEQIVFAGASLLVSGPPVAHDDVYYLMQDDSLLVGSGEGVLANDERDVGETLTAELVTPADYGIVRLNSDGSFEYTPEPGYAGWDQFTYRASDGYFESPTATVYINVVSSGSTLVAVEDYYFLDVDGGLSVEREGGVLANDQYAGYPPATAELVAGTEYGQLIFRADGSFVYTPDSSFAGQDQFSYEFDTGLAVSNVAVVQLVAQDFDSDLDGVSDHEENDAPNGGDFNVDGIPDRQQGHVASLRSADRSEYVLFETQPSTPFREMRTVTPPAASGAPNAEFAYGFFGFEIHGLAPGGEATATFQSEEALQANTVYRVGPTPDDTSTHWYLFMRNDTSGAMVFSDRVELAYVDGARGDDDLLADGVLTNLVLGIATADKPWRNPVLPDDVDNSGSVTPADVLILINLINKGGARVLPATPDAGTAIPSFVDPTGDNRLTPEDVLQIINTLNEQAGGGGFQSEGEPALAPESRAAAPETSGDEASAAPALTAPQATSVPSPLLASSLSSSVVVPVQELERRPPPEEPRADMAWPGAVQEEDDEPLLRSPQLPARGEEDLELAIDEIAHAWDPF